MIKLIIRNALLHVLRSLINAAFGIDADDNQYLSVIADVAVIFITRMVADATTMVVIMITMKVIKWIVAWWRKRNINHT